MSTPTAVVRGLSLGLVLVVTACASGQPSPAPLTPMAAEPVTLTIVRRSLVRQMVQDGASLVRSGVARLVTQIPLDATRAERLGPAVAHAFVAERLVYEVAARLEQSFTAEERAAIATALASQTAFLDATHAEADNAQLQAFLAKGALPHDRQIRVQALVAVTLSPGIIDALTRAPVATAARVVAAALPDGDDDGRAVLSRLAPEGPTSDPRAQAAAFAFLWRDLDDATLDAAIEFYASELGMRLMRALVTATVAGLATMATEVEHDLRR